MNTRNIGNPWRIVGWLVVGLACVAAILVIVLGMASLSSGATRPTLSPSDQARVTSIENAQPAASGGTTP